MLIDGKDGDLQYGHDEELHRAGFTQNGAKWNQDRSCAEICIDYSAGVRTKVLRKNINRHHLWSIRTTHVQDLALFSMYLVMM